VPFIGGVLVLAVNGAVLWPLLGMLAFAVAFAAPFFLLALFPEWLRSLPKSGGWLNAIKIVLGFVEIAAALKFLSNADLVWHTGLLTRRIFLLLWLALAVLTAVYVAGYIRFAHDTPARPLGLWRKVWTAGFAGVALWLTAGLFGARLGTLDAYLPPQPDDWLHDYHLALVEAQRSGKPVFVDFSGYTCTNCRDMEANVFPEARVARLLDNFVRVRLYTDGQRDADERASSTRNQRLMEERYHTSALPLYAIVTADDQPVADTAGSQSVAEFVKFLDEGLKQARQRQAVSAR
jgi:thiol:disulfide interchange protein DsbD